MAVKEKVFDEEEVKFIKKIWLSMLENNEQPMIGEDWLYEVGIAVDEERAALVGETTPYMHYHVPYNEQWATEICLLNNEDYTPYDMLTILQVINHNIDYVHKDPNTDPMVIISKM